MKTPIPHAPRIVVGIDGSDQANAALDWAIGMARLLKAEIIAVYAIDIPPYAYMSYVSVPPPQMDPMWLAQMEKEFTQDWCAPLRESGVAYRTVIEAGRPALRIIAVADEVDADLVVTGRRGRGGVAELVLGSTSHEVSLHCKRPLVLISSPHAVVPETLPVAVGANGGVP